MKRCKSSNVILVGKSSRTLESEKIREKWILEEEKLRDFLSAAEECLEKGGESSSRIVTEFKGKGDFSRKSKEAITERSYFTWTDPKEFKSGAMLSAFSKLEKKKPEAVYNLTIHDGNEFKTIAATAQDVKEYLKDKDYFKMKRQNAKEWKKLRREINKRTAEKEAEERYQKEAKMLEERANCRNYCEEQLHLVGRYYQNGKIPDVVRCSENFLKYLKKKSDKELPRKWIYLATAYNYLARAYSEQEDFEKARTCGEKSYKIAISSNNSELIGQSYVLSGKIYAKFKKYEEAAFVWEKLIPLIGEEEKKSWLFHEIGRCYFELEKYPLSRKYGKESAIWADKSRSATWSCAANILLGQIQIKTNEFTEALNAFSEAEKHARLAEDEKTLKYVTDVRDALRLALTKPN